MKRHGGLAKRTQARPCLNTNFSTPLPSVAGKMVVPSTQFAFFPMFSYLCVDLHLLLVFLSLLLLILNLFFILKWIVFLTSELHFCGEWLSIFVNVVPRKFLMIINANWFKLFYVKIKLLKVSLGSERGRLEGNISEKYFRLGGDFVHVKWIVPLSYLLG